MPLFSWRLKSAGGASQRFRQASFQERIRRARDFRRKPRIAPQAKTTLRVGQFRFTIVYAIATCVLLGAVSIYFLVFSPYFLVQSVRVAGTSQTPPELIEQAVRDQAGERLWYTIPRSHMLFMNRSYLENLLLSKFPKLIAVQKLQRHWPHTLAITVEERTPVAIWQAGGAYYYLGHDGVIADALPPGYATSTPSYLHIEDRSGQTVQSGQRLRTEGLMAFIELLRSSWKQKTTTEVVRVVLQGAASPDVFVTSSVGWTAYFDMRENTLRQLENLHLLLTGEILPDRHAQLAYIDLRLPTVAYYCFRSEPCAAVTTPENANSILPKAK